MDVRITGVFRLRAPLSHIGDTISTNSYLVEEPILQPHGATESVFVYSGNAWRGQLRDLAAIYMLDYLNCLVPLPSFALLFFGGGIGGEQEVDVDKVRRYRRALPILALFGGGVGNQILPGKLRVANCYPLCQEALPVLPSEHHPVAERVSYRSLTFEKSFSRKDDTKDPRLERYRADLAERALPEQSALGLPASADGQAEAEDAASAGKSRRRSSGQPPDQMRFTSELLAAGTLLDTRLDLIGVTQVELGCLVSALVRFGRRPYLGGQAARGHGLVDLTYEIIDLDTGRREPFLSVSAEAVALAPPAAEARLAYDRLLDEYRQALDGHASDIRALLGAEERASEESAP